MSKRNLILSIVHGYDYVVLEPFLKSLSATNFDGDLVVFVSETVSKTTKALLKRKGAIIIDFKSKYPFIDGYVDMFKDITKSITINNYRFLFYLQYLKNNLDEYNNIMLTDIRDVIFQRNIFDRIDNDKIYYFLEDPSQTFRNSALNYEWSLLANGPEITQQMIDETVSCAGIVIGAYQQIINYLEYIRKQLADRDNLPWGFDQAVHNACIYTLDNSSANIISNNKPLVLTLGACSGFSLTANGLLINEHDEPYAVIHQYDRFGNLLVLLKRKYIGMRLLQLIKKTAFLLLP